MRHRLQQFIFLALCALLIWPLTLQAQLPGSLNFKALDGNNVSIADLQGRVVIISFSAKGIPLAQIELPQLERLANKYDSQGLTVVWVSTNSSRPKASNFASDEELRTMAAQYPHIKLVRIADDSYRQLGIDTLPTIIILDQQGKQVGKPQAGIDPQANLGNSLSPIINRLLTK